MSESSARDQVYRLPLQHVGDFAFDESVADVFPDMIARSVPGYASVLSMIEQLAGRFVRPATRVYDLGCSLGAASVLMRRQLPPDCEILAIDNSPAMVERLQRRMAELAASDGQPCCSVQVRLEDVRTSVVENASFVVLNWTLQFVPAAERQGLLEKIFEGLLPGGGLLLSEKICFEQSEQQQLLADLHHDFKRAHGYSELEISQKRAALEKTLIPESLEVHLQRLRSAGFAVVAPWFQCFNFVSILAIKAGSADV